MPRSKKKIPYVDPKLLEKVRKLKQNATALGSKDIIVKTWSRRSTIIEGMIGITFQVHNGKDFITVKVDGAKVGHKLGEFSPTRKFGGHKEKAKETAKKGGK